MKKIDLQKRFREHIKECSGEPMFRNLAGSQIEADCLSFIQKEIEHLENEIKRIHEYNDKIKSDLLGEC